MMQRSKWIGLAAGLMLALASTGCGKLKSRDEMNRGVQSYKSGKYQDAIKHFQAAVQSDPTNQNAQLYLATSYMTQWIPGADSEDNNRMRKAAQDEFSKVLDKDPKDKIALASMASMAYNSAQSGTQEQKDQFLEEARKWNRRRIEVDPNDAEAYYSLGVISWTQAYPAIQTVRANTGMKAEDPGPIKDKKKRAEMKEKYGKMIDDGLGDLQKAIDIDKQYDDAMSYMNLLLRKKADIEDTPDEAKADIAKATEWADKSLEVKKTKAAQPQKKQES